MKTGRRSAIWGGATLGVLVGAVLGGLGSAPFWGAVLGGAAAGAAIGAVATTLGVVADWLREESEPRYGSKPEIAAYRLELAARGMSEDDIKNNVAQFRRSGYRFLRTEGELNAYLAELTDVDAATAFALSKEFGLTGVRPERADPSSPAGSV